MKNSLLGRIAHDRSNDARIGVIRSAPYAHRHNSQCFVLIEEDNGTLGQHPTDDIRLLPDVESKSISEIFIVTEKDSAWIICGSSTMSIGAVQDLPLGPHEKFRLVPMNQEDKKCRSES